MRTALRPDVLASVYDRLACRYDWQHSLLTAGTDERGRRLVVGATVRPGDRVLDAGAGTGSTALLAARAAGPRGDVTLLDLSTEMLAEARCKAAGAGLAARTRFRNGDILRLPYTDGSFDAVLSTCSLCPLFDPVRGALELYRVLRPGGRIGVVHSTSPRNPAVHWLAERIEDVAWRFPGVSMGCRVVSVLPALRKAGAMLLFERRIGVPLYPFLVFVAEKPDGPR